MGKKKFGATETITGHKNKIQELECTRKDLQSRFAESEKINNSLNQDSKELIKRNKEIKQAYTEIEGIKCGFEKANIDHIKRIQEMEGAEKKYQARCTELEKTITDLQQDNKEKIGIAQAIDQGYKELERRNSKLEKFSTECKTRNQELEQIQEECHSKINDLVKEKDDLEQSKALQENQFKEFHQRRVDELAQEKKENQQEMERVEQCRIQETQQRRVDELAQAERDHQEKIDRVEQRAKKDLEQADSEHRIKYSELQRSLEDLKIKYPNVEEANKRLQERLDAMRIDLDKIKNKDTEPVKENVNDYDCILNVENFRDISNQGWILQLPPQEYDFKQKKSGSVFALVGLYNKGKTFILNQLTNLFFGSGQSYTTKGISMKEVTIDNDKFFVLDTAVLILL